MSRYVPLKLQLYSQKYNLLFRNTFIDFDVFLFLPLFILITLSIISFIVFFIISFGCLSFSCFNTSRYVPLKLQWNSQMKSFSLLFFLTFTFFFLFRWFSTKSTISFIAVITTSFKCSLFSCFFNNSYWSNRFVQYTHW